MLKTKYEQKIRKYKTKYLEMKSGSPSYASHTYDLYKKADYRNRCEPDVCRAGLGPDCENPNHWGCYGCDPRANKCRNYTEMSTTVKDQIRRGVIEGLDLVLHQYFPTDERLLLLGKINPRFLLLRSQIGNYRCGHREMNRLTEIIVDICVSIYMYSRLHDPPRDDGRQIVRTLGIHDRPWGTGLPFSGSRLPNAIHQTIVRLYRRIKASRVPNTRGLTMSELFCLLLWTCCSSGVNPNIPPQNDRFLIYNQINNLTRKYGLSPKVGLYQKYIRMTLSAIHKLEPIREGVQDGPTQDTRDETTFLYRGLSQLSPHNQLRVNDLVYYNQFLNSASTSEQTASAFTGNNGVMIIFELFTGMGDTTRSNFRWIPPEYSAFATEREAITIGGKSVFQVNSIGPADGDANSSILQIRLREYIEPEEVFGSALDNAKQL